MEDREHKQSRKTGDAIEMTETKGPGEDRQTVEIGDNTAARDTRPKKAAGDTGETVGTGENRAARRYTIPVMLLIMVILGIIIVTLLTRLLVTEQRLVTHEGKRLAKGYAACVSLGAQAVPALEALLAAETAAERLPVKAQLGALKPLADGCAELLAEAAAREGEDSPDAEAAVREALNRIAAKLGPVGNHEGPLTETERDMAIAALEAAKAWSDALRVYRVPESDQNYRLMEGGGPWVDAAVQAASLLEELAGRLENM